MSYIFLFAEINGIKQLIITIVMTSYQIIIYLNDIVMNISFSIIKSYQYVPIVGLHLFTFFINL